MTGVRLVAAIAWFWGSVGANDEATRWLRQGLQTAGLADVERARLLEGMAMHSFASGDMDAGRRVAEEAAGLWERVGTPGRGFAALVYRGLAERARGELDAAAVTLDQAIEIATRSYSDWAVAVASYWRAAVAADQADDESAGLLLQEARWRAERAGDRRAIGAMLHQLGRIALRSGDGVRALDLARQALAIHEAVGWKAGIAGAHDAIGRALLAVGRPTEAISAHRRGLRRAVEIGAPQAIANGLEGLAETMAAAGDLDAAAEVLGAAGARQRARGGGADPPTGGHGPGRVVAHRAGRGCLRGRPEARSAQAAGGRHGGGRRPWLTNGLQLDVEVDDSLDQTAAPSQREVPGESERFAIDRPPAREHAAWRVGRLGDRAPVVDVEIDVVADADDRQPPVEAHAPAGPDGARGAERRRRMAGDVEVLGRAEPAVVVGRTGVDRRGVDVQRERRVVAGDVEVAGHHGEPRPQRRHPAPAHGEAGVAALGVDHPSSRSVAHRAEDAPGR